MCRCESPAVRSHRYLLLPLPALLVTGFVLSWNTLSSYFVSDDFGQLFTLVKHGPFGLWTSFGNFLRPLSSLSLYLDYLLWGLEPLGYHVTNVLLHSLCAYMLFLVTHRLLTGSPLLRRFPSVPHVTALLFLVLPSHSESVAWVSDRVDLMPALLALASFHSYLLFTMKPRLPWLVASSTLFFGALLSKESVVAFPAVIICFEAHRLLGRRPTRHQLGNAALVSLLFVVLLAFYVVLRLQVTGSLISGWVQSKYSDIDAHLVLTNVLRMPAKTLLSTLGDNTAALIVAAVVSGAAVLVAIGRLVLARRNGRQDRRIVSLTAFLGLAAFSQFLPILPL
ncbi:MAG: hypothetical protein AB1486_29365 [Planctomycetota bacterium]